MPEGGDSFVGRQRELADLSAALDQAIAGEGRIVMVAGEPGIGKTRIAQELALRAAQRDAAVLWGYCPEEAGAPPYWPWVQALRGALRAPEALASLAELGSGAGDIADIVPEVRTLLPDIGTPARLEDASQARFRMFHSVRQFRAIWTMRPMHSVSQCRRVSFRPPVSLDWRWVAGPDISPANMG